MKAISTMFFRNRQPQEPKPPTARYQSPKEQARAITARLLRRIDTIDDFNLTPWERVIKYARKMAMIKHLNRYKTERDVIKYVIGDEAKKLIDDCEFQIRSAAEEGIFEANFDHFCERNEFMDETVLNVDEFLNSHNP